MSEQLSLKELYHFTFATNNRVAKIEAGIEMDDDPHKFTVFYHRDRGGREETVMVQDVNEIIEESKWNPLLEEGFERVAYLLEGSNSITVGETGEGKIFELADGGESPNVGDRVQIQLYEE